MRKIETPVLEISNLCKSEKDKVIEGLNIIIPKGDSFAVVYENEKTAELLTDILGGKVKTQKGKIYFKGDDVTGEKNNFGVVGKKSNLVKMKNVADNAAVPIVKRGLARSMANVLVKKELKVFALDEYADKSVANLPKKEAARAELFAAYMCSHELMVIDEPFFDLNDEERAEELARLCNIQKSANISFLILTKNIDIAVKLSDTVMVVNDKFQSVGMVGVDKRRLDKTVEKIDELVVKSYKL